MRRLSRALVVAGLVASSCSSTEPSSDASQSQGPPSVSPTIDVSTLSGKILFTRAGGRFGDETVFTANADGSNEQRISGFGKTCCPRWLPDGSAIRWAASAPDGRFTTGTVDPDGSNLRLLPLPPGDLNLGCAQAVSRTTDKLACDGFSFDDESSGGIYLVNPDGTGLRRLTRGSDRSMDFSPDGREVYFLRGGDESGSLYVIGVDGGKPRRVTPPDVQVDVVGNAGGRLSPDGEWIIFTSSGVMWEIHPDGSGLGKVFEDVDGRLAITPTWSPDGRYILFGLDPAGSASDIDSAPPNGLYVIEADGTKLTPIIMSDDWKREPDWVA